MDATEKGAVFLSVATDIATPRAMGRPPLNLIRVPVRVSPEALAEIDEKVGTYGRARFIRDAIAEKLDREREGK